MMPPASTIRVLLVDLRPVVIKGLRDLINANRPGMEVVGQAGSYEDAIELAYRTHPDVVLLRIFADALDAPDVISALTHRCKAKVLILKSLYESVSIGKAVEAGALGVVPSEGRDEQLIEAIIKARGNDPLGIRDGVHPVLLAPDRMRRKGDADHAKLDQLTLREKEVIRAIAAAPSAKYLSIADRLGISEHTVHNHLSKIYQKLDLTNRIDLLIYALKHGLNEDDDLPAALVKLHRTGRPAPRHAAQGTARNPQA